MREIIFRGKRIDNGEWIEGSYIHLNVNADFICQGRSFNSLIPIKLEVIPSTVGQYIGIPDKNGKKIFEGDIVKAYSICGEEEGIGVVYWSELFVAWHYANNKSMYSGDIASYEVIGNIHDNPEVLKEA